MVDEKKGKLDLDNRIRNGKGSNWFGRLEVPDFIVERTQANDGRSGRRDHTSPTRLGHAANT